MNLFTRRHAVTCPYCKEENIPPMWSTESNVGTLVRCYACNRIIFLDGGRVGAVPVEFTPEQAT